MLCLYLKVGKPHLVWECGCALSRFIASVARESRERRRSSPQRKEEYQHPGNFGLDSKEKKALKWRLLQNEKETTTHHVFKQLYPWKTKLELAQHLKNTEVYNNDVTGFRLPEVTLRVKSTFGEAIHRQLTKVQFRQITSRFKGVHPSLLLMVAQPCAAGAPGKGVLGGLIALCKPYGIAQVPVNPAGDGGSHTVIQTLASGGLPDHTPTVHDTLPYLRELYSVPHLEVIKSTERWSSGLILLSTNKEITEKVQKCLRRSKSFNQPALTYWAVTVGLPKPTCIAKKVACTLEFVNNTGKVPVILKNYSNANVKKGEVKLSTVEHNTLMFNKETEASLVEVNTQGVRWHFLRVWLSYCYSPVLGDALYSARVKTVSGRRVQISPHNLSSYEPQVVPKHLFSKLELQPTAVEMIPCHLHLAKIQLAQFEKDRSDLSISVPPPSHFMWTCRQLGLMSGEEDCTTEAEVKTEQQKENEG